MFAKRCLVLFFVHCLLILISSANQTSFCQKYNCDCKESSLNVKCSFNSSVKSIELLDASIDLLDLSDNFLESTLIFGDTPLNLEKLILRNNSITEIHENLFNKMPHLHYLDLSMNKIERVQEIAFTTLNMLNYLNLSKSFVAEYKISRDICQLVNIKILDLSYSNLLEFDLECWKTSRLLELYMKNTLNVENSWQKWFQYIQNTIKLIDLSGSDVIILDSSLATSAPILNSLILRDLPKLDKASLQSVLSTDRLIERLNRLVIGNINASQSNLPILNMLKISSNNSNNSSLSLIELDISNNQYSYDLSTLLFSRRNLKNLKIFKASGNRFRSCAANLTTGTSDLVSLEYLDLSYNQIESSSCLFALKPLTKLNYLNLSHNQLSISSSEYLNLTNIFTNKLNLSNIDLSSNRLDKFVVYLSLNHAEINNFDLSNNNLRLFKFLSVSSVERAAKTTKVQGANSIGIKQGLDNFVVDQDDDEDDDQNGEDDDEDDVDILIENHHKEMNSEKVDNDDDIRNIVINSLNLSSNQFQVVHINHMFQSIKNIETLDLSSNPITQVNGLSGDPQLIKEEAKNQTENSKLEALCIDILDLSKCQVKRMPNLQHSCINRIDLDSNLMVGSIHLMLSKYSVYFLDYLNLQSNDIKFIKLIISEQKFKQDTYRIQNSPFHFFSGSKNMIDKDNTTSIHTFIDLRNNKNFKCDCYLSKLTVSFQSLKFLSECDEIYFNSTECFRKQQQQQQQPQEQPNASNGLNLNTLNKNLRALFIITFLLLIALSCFVIYYLCSDFIKTLHYRSVLDRLLVFFNLKRKFDSFTNQNHNSNVGVQYSKLVNETASSQVELNHN